MGDLTDIEYLDKSNHLYTELMLRALDMALQKRRHEGVILHSDKAVNIRPLPLAGAVAKQVCSRQWGLRVMRMTTRCASRSSEHSKRNCSVANTSLLTRALSG
ncbi:hypothetical protein LMG22931_07042 [Paraburkholderia nemoris]|nr:hypothetical protein LMG22931_07042 [Paraburkholderia nemoris]